MKIAFFWTWDFSKNILKNILSHKKSPDIKLIVSQIDKHIWRKMILTETPVKIFAKEKNIEILQPEILKNNNIFFEKLKSLNLDFIVVVAYWKIIPKEILKIPKFGCINIHWSLLPLYRWASPIQESLKNWDKKTWLTIMYMSEWMDEWDILKQKEIEIDILDKTPDIFEKFEKIWADLLLESLEEIILWNIKWQKQDSSKVSYCSKIEKKHWEINFKTETAEDIYNKFRAYFPWPWIFTFYNWKKFTIENCFFENTQINNENLSIWDVIKINNEIWIICKKWILILKIVKLEWKKSNDIKSFINWNKNFLNYNFLKS